MHHISTTKTNFGGFTQNRREDVFDWLILGDTLNEFWKTLIPLGSAVVAGLALLYQIRRSNHPLTGAHERASRALGLAKSLSELVIPEADRESNRKSRALQGELVKQGLVATQQFLGHATPALTSHKQTWVFAALIPISFVALTINAIGLRADSVAYAVVIGAIVVVPMMFGIVTNVVYGRVARHKDTIKNLDDAAQKLGVKELTIPAGSKR